MPDTSNKENQKRIRIKRAETKTNNENSVKDKSATKSPSGEIYAKNRSILQGCKKLKTELHIPQDVIEAADACLISLEKARNEDAKRADVIKQTLPSLSKRLSKKKSPTSCASFRHMRLMRKYLVPIVAALFCDDDQEVALVTISRPGSNFNSTDYKAHNPRADFKQINRFLRKNISIARNGGCFGVGEYAPENGKIKPHLQAIVSGERLERIRDLKEAGGNGFDIHIQELGPPINPEAKRSKYFKGFTRRDCVSLVKSIDYLLKGATYKKLQIHKTEEDDLETEPTSSRPLDADEIAMLSIRNRGDLSEYIIWGGFPELRAVLGGRSDILKQKTETDGFTKSLLNFEVGHGLKASKLGWSSNRVALPKFGDLREMTCHHLSLRLDNMDLQAQKELDAALNDDDMSDMSSAELDAFRKKLQDTQRRNQGWTEIEHDKLKRIAKVELNEHCDIYLVDIEGTIGSFIHERKSAEKGLKSELAVLGIPLLTSSTKTTVMSVFETLRTKEKVKLLDRGGLVWWNDEAMPGYLLTNGQFISPPGSTPFVYPSAIFEAESDRSAGSVDAFEACLCPMIKGRPISIAVLGHALSPIVRSIEDAKVSGAQQGSIKLFGGTSNGKSTLAKSVATALWNSPEGMKTLLMTLNKVTSLLECYSGSVAVFDETTSLSTEGKVRQAITGQIIHAISAGTDKGRLNEVSSSGANHTLSGILTSNEKGDEHKIDSDDTESGVNVRTILFNTDDVSLIFNKLDVKHRESIAELNAVAKKNFGHIGPMIAAEICNCLASHKSETIACLDQLYAEFLEACDQEEQKQIDEHGSCTNALMRSASIHAASYVVLRFAQIRGILPAHIWGDFFDPMFNAFLHSSRQAGYIGEEVTKTGRKKELVSKLKTRLKKMYEKYPERFVEINQKRPPIMKDKDANAKVFWGFNQSSGFHFIAIKNEKLILKVLGYKSSNELKKLKAAKLLHIKKAKSLKSNFVLRRRPNQKKASAEDAYILKFGASLFK